MSTTLAPVEFALPLRTQDEDSILGEVRLACGHTLALKVPRGPEAHPNLHLYERALRLQDTRCEICTAAETLTEENGKFSYLAHVLTCEAHPLAGWLVVTYQHKCGHVKENPLLCETPLGPPEDRLISVRVDAKLYGDVRCPECRTPEDRASDARFWNRVWGMDASPKPELDFLKCEGGHVDPVRMPVEEGIASRRSHGKVLCAECRGEGGSDA